MKEIKENNSILQSVQNGLRILNLFTKDAPVWGITEIANNLHLNKTTVSRLVGDLVSEGYLQKEKSKYCLGYSLLCLSGVITSHLEIHRESKEPLRRLVDHLGETAHVAVLEGSGITYVHKIECKNPVHLLSYIGKKNPVSCTSSGKVLLAFQKKNVFEAIIKAGLPKMGPNSVIEPVLLKSQLKDIKEQGYSVCIDELHEGVVSIAAPIRDYTGEVIAAISIVGTKQRIREEKLKEFIQQIMAAGDDISIKLGYIPAAFWKE
jgi:IclR family transcriptional regulator, KDG regulon repressor